MTSVDDFIARHAQRLQEHHAFLEKRGNEEETTELGSQQRRDAPATNSRHQKNQREGSADDEEQGELDGQAPPREYADHDIEHFFGGNFDNSYPQSSSIRRDDRSAFTDPASENYHVSDEAAVFERSRRWTQAREQSLERQRKEKEMRELEGCTFRPNATRYDSGNRGGGSGSAVHENGTSPPVTKSSAIKAHVERQEIARKLKEEKEKKMVFETSNWKPRRTVPQEFLFGQKLSRIAALKKPVPTISGEGQEDDEEDSRRAEPPPHRDYSAYESHISEARERSASLDRVSKKDRSSTSAAKKAKKNSTPTRARTPTSSKAKLSPESAAKREKYHARKAQAATGNSPLKNGQQQQQNTGSSSLSPSSSPASHKGEVEFLRARVKDQDEQIAQLHVMVSSLKRELDVAKSKVRQLSIMQRMNDHMQLS